jgi:hypothetical protein
MWGSGNATPLISALDGDQWLPSRPDRFTPEEEFPVPTEYETRRDTELVWTFGEETSLGMGPRFFGLPARCLFSYWPKYRGVRTFDCLLKHYSINTNVGLLVYLHSYFTHHH